MRILVFTILLSIKVFLPSSIFGQGIQKESGNTANFGLFTKTTDEIKIALLPFSYTNMSSSLAQAYADELAIALLQHTSFQIISPEQVEEILAQRGLNLGECSDISCAQLTADETDADYFIISKINFTNNSFELENRLIASVSQDLILAENTSFNRDNFNDAFFEISKKTKEHIPLNAKIVNFNQNRAIINIGSNQGIKVGDKLVSYHKPPQEVKQGPKERLDGSYDDTKTTIFYGPNLKMVAANILVVEQALPNSSVTNYLLSSNMIGKGDLVKTYLDKIKQEAFVETSRKAVDRFYQFAPNIKKENLPTFETVLVEEKILDYDKVEWMKKVRQQERKREIYRWATIGAVSATAITFISLKSLWPATLILGAVSGYSLITFIDARASVHDLVDEGKFKNYLDVKWPQQKPPNNEELRPKQNSQLKLKNNVLLLSYNLKF